MTKNPYSSSPRSGKARSWLFGITMLAVTGWLVTACSVSDVFRSNPDEGSSPSASATPTPAGARDSRAHFDWRHRYVLNPPHGQYDPDLTARSVEDQLLELAAERWAETETVHFDLSVDGSTYLDVNETIELKSVEGDLKRPDQAQAEADVQIGFASFDVGLIVFGDNAYMTNFLTGNWERAPANFAFNPALIFDDERGVGSVLDSMTDVEAGEESTIGGTSVVEVSGKVEQEDISQLVAGSLEGDEIGVSFWMDVDSGDILQISLSEPDDVEDDPTTWTIEFTGHNDPVTIEEPDL